MFDTTSSKAIHSLARTIAKQSVDVDFIVEICAISAEQQIIDEHMHTMIVNWFRAKLEHIIA